MSWESVTRRVGSGPSWTIILIVALLLVMSVIGRGCSVLNEAANVAQSELGPAALLKKYTWFKDAAASLDAKRADIAVYESMASKHGNSELADSEVAGMKASYNRLAAEYNAAMSKINYRFCNVGDLPPGAEPLPREFRNYVNQ